MGSERRAHRRYVIDGMMVELAGTAHETIDISSYAMAVVRRPGTLLAPGYRFVNPAVPALTQPILRIRHLMDRGHLIILQYEVADPNWEKVLAAHDVRADLVQLEDVFG